MKKELSILLSLFLLMTSLKAGLRWESTQLEFQATLDQTEQEAIFRFTNDSDYAVEITKVRSSCGCTVAVLDKDYYLPGESGELKAVFRFGSRQGRQSKKVRVSYEESIPDDFVSNGALLLESSEKAPKKGDYILELVTHIPEKVSISTQYLSWKVGGDAETHDVTMIPAKTYPVNLEFTSEPVGFEVEAIPLEGNRGITLRVTPTDTSKKVKNFISVKAVKDNKIENIYRVLLMIR